MKRYLLFAGDTYYPRGGWDDFIEDFDLFSQAQQKSIEISGTGLMFDWYHIVDAQTKEIIQHG